jgi:hypothetical protein
MLSDALPKVVLPLALSIGAAFALAAPNPPAGAKPAPVAADKSAPAAFDRFKALAGEWVAAEDGEMFKK